MGVRHRFRVSGFGFRVLAFGFRVSGFGFRLLGFGFRVSCFGFRMMGVGFRALGFGRGPMVIDDEDARGGFWEHRRTGEVLGGLSPSRSLDGLILIKFLRPRSRPAKVNRPCTCTAPAIKSQERTPEGPHTGVPPRAVWRGAPRTFHARALDGVDSFKSVPGYDIHF